MKLKLSAIEPNNGQIEGLPKNPRFIKSEKQWWEDEDKRGTDNDEITDVPQQFKTLVGNNQDRIARAEQRGTLPYF